MGSGRKVVVDFLDSKLNPNETTNAEISACQNDVATVGTSAVFLTSVDNMRNCKDSTGAVTGLPDIPFVSTALVQQCSGEIDSVISLLTGKMSDRVLALLCDREKGLFPASAQLSLSCS